MKTQGTLLLQAGPNCPVLTPGKQEAIQQKDQTEQLRATLGCMRLPSG